MFCRFKPSITLPWIEWVVVCHQLFADRVDVSFIHSTPPKDLPYHPWKLTWNPKSWSFEVLCKQVIFQVPAVRFPGCRSLKSAQCHVSKKSLLANAHPSEMFGESCGLRPWLPWLSQVHGCFNHETNDLFGSALWFGVQNVTSELEKNPKPWLF